MYFFIQSNSFLHANLSSYPNDSQRFRTPTHKPPRRRQKSPCDSWSRSQSRQMSTRPIGAAFTASAQAQSIPKESATGLQPLSPLSWVDFFAPRHPLFCGATGSARVWPLPRPWCSCRLFRIVGKTRRTPCRSGQRLERIHVCS